MILFTLNAPLNHSGIFFCLYEIKCYKFVSDKRSYNLNSNRMKTTPHDLAAYKRMLEGKIKALQFIGSNLSRSKRITYQVTFDCGSQVFIEQNIIPFNLEMELRTLVDDSIDYYQRQLVNANTGNYEQI